MELAITARARDIGGFSVRRLLPYAKHRMVGPFIFFDHMGPAEFAAGQGMDVRPHPHIHLATVTYLFEGVIHHRDSLGSDQLIEPGAINWMTAGRGIVHSERSPQAVRKGPSRLHGIQLWVALPTKHEETEPSFKHHPKSSLPEFSLGQARLKLLLGEAYGERSPVTLHSELFYLEAKVPKGERLVLPHGPEIETAFYVVNGVVECSGATHGAYTMVISRPGETLDFTAQEDTLAMIIGGRPLGPRQIYWNFVSSSQDAIENAKAEWHKGPGPDNRRFGLIVGDSDEFIPLPE